MVGRSLRQRRVGLDQRKCQDKRPIDGPSKDGQHGHSHACHPTDMTCQPVSHHTTALPWARWYVSHASMASRAASSDTAVVMATINQRTGLAFLSAALA